MGLSKWLLGLGVCGGLLAGGPALDGATAESIAETPGSALQDMLDAHPGQVQDVSGEVYIEQALVIRSDGGGLSGTGRIIQKNPAANIIEVTGRSGVRLCGVTLIRSRGFEESAQSAVDARDCVGLDIDNVRVLDNRSNAGTIRLERCRSSRVRGCEVINYKRIAVDDRTSSELYGYAFRVIDGTGILITECGGVQVLDNRVIERHLMPDLKTKETFRLGEFVEGKNPAKPGPLAPKDNYANNWHQGSAIVVTAPEATHHVLISGNLIENAAQGIDLHADQVTCSENIIDHAFIGIKCMHGSRNVIISGNNVSNIDLWGLEMQSGTASHAAEAAAGDTPAREANVTSGNIIANNVFSGFGRGHEYFNWKGARGGVINLETGPLPENPVMTDILIQGNVVYDSNRDLPLAENGAPPPPNYEWAVYVTPEPAPKGLVFSGNLFHPGRGGVCNVPLAP